MVQFVKKHGIFNCRKRKYSLRQKIIIWYRIRILDVPPICARYFPLKKKYIINPERERYQLLKIDGVIYHLDFNSKTAYVTQDKNVNFSEIKILDNLEYKRKKFEVTEIGLAGFARSFNLKKIFIPESVKRICRGAFLECKNLQLVSLPGNSRINFDEAVFNGCNFNKLQLIHRNEKSR